MRVKAKMLNHFNFKTIDEGKILATNDFGQYVVLDIQDFNSLLSGSINRETELYDMLRNKHFLLEREDLLSEEILDQMRNAKNYLFLPTSLHIFVVTNMCNANCVYCQARTKEHPTHGLMTKETGEKAVDIALQSPTDQLTFEFQGGEPLINFDTIKHIVEYSEENKKDKSIEYTIVSNLSLLTDEMAAFFKKYEFKVSTSVDGPMKLHDTNRPLLSNQSLFEKTKEGIQKIRAADIPVGAIETTTRYSMSFSQEIVQTYIELGFSSIFLRMLTPLGFAQEEWSKIGYTAEEYVDFYKSALEIIIEQCKNGVYICENTATIFLQKILNGHAVNYMELRSPCGATLGQLAYYYDGSIYTCDEARMISEAGDQTFKLGDVFNSRYTDLVNSKTCRAVCASSILETLPGCCDCVYMPYCGVCPVINYAIQGDPILQYAHGYRCKVYSGILDFLFEKLIKGDKETKEILCSWVRE